MRTIGVVAERSIGPATPAAPATDRYVVLDRLRECVDRIEWAPLRLGAERRPRPTSPRLPHALLLHIAHAARAGGDRGTAVASIDAPVDADALASFLGTDVEGVLGALDALDRAGAVHRPTAATGWDRGVRLDATLLGPEPRCAALDWGQLALATAGSPSAWVAAHVLAERLAPDEWTPMPRSALERTLECGVSGVRSALDRLTATGIVERREQRGGVSAYRFAPTAYGAGAGQQGRAGEGRAPRPSLASPAPSVQPSSAHARAPAPTPPAPIASAPVASAPSAHAATGVRLTVGGVELEVPPGLRVRVELGADGTPQISLVPVAPPVT